jgi:CelD/BcsL family acetyltransferase involved in cellulose biosynthesis
VTTDLEWASQRSCDPSRTTPPAHMKLELVDPYSPRVEEVWLALQAKAQPPYFLTWGWMENWLACLPRHEAPRLAVLHHDGEPVGACFVGKRRVRRHGIVASRALYVNATGLEDYDELCLEHNALLAVPDRGASLASLVSSLPGDWDELFLPAMGGHTFDELERATLPLGTRVMKDREVANYHVDLERVRGSKEGYIPLLGSSTRAQMRKAQRAAGDVEVEIASDERTALDIYEEMVVLHQRSWRMRGQPGAFADPWFDRFHRRLIARRVRHGDIQLVRVRNKELTLGCLYNFVSAGAPNPHW